MKTISTYDVELAHKQKAGGHWFDADAKRFFDSRVADTAYVSDDEKRAYFVSSERFRGFRAPDGDRLYSVRMCNMETGAIDTIGKFQAYRSRSGADAAARRMALKKGK